MKSFRFFVALTACVCLSGCAHGLIGSLPAVDDPANASEIFVVRGYHYLGHESSAYVAFDNNTFLAIRVSEYTKFFAPPGEHTISVKANEVRTPSSIRLQFAPKAKYYFQITPGWGMFHLAQLTEQEAGPYLAEDTFLPLVKPAKPETPREGTPK